MQKMQIEQKEVTIGDLTNGYKDNFEKGVVGYGGKLDIRPAYQREFVYGDREKKAVIASVMKGFPLGSFYWAELPDGTYELLDGQQRSLSICSFVSGEYSVMIGDKPMFFHNIKASFPELAKDILDYKLFVHVCKGGSQQDRHEWFKTINIAGVKLTPQELRNSVYTGPWLEDAKRFFSKKNCAAFNIGNDYVTGSTIRQDFLETALDWITSRDAEIDIDARICKYMAKHQNDENADELKNCFTGVISWVKGVFTEYRPSMKGVNWGNLARVYGPNGYVPEEVEKLVKKHMENEEITDKKGIYEYVLSGESEDVARKLSRRSFSISQKTTKYEQQDGICPICGKKFALSEMEGDHIIPWWNGGKTVIENLQMLCKKCNRTKGGSLNG